MIHNEHLEGAKQEEEEDDGFGTDWASGFA